MANGGGGGGRAPGGEAARPPRGDRSDGPLTFAAVLEEERRLLDERRARCRAAGEPFSLAFSGGGVRAAAFQAGVLWRLAEGGHLRDVEYMTAVSGGGYITAAFISQLLGSEAPAEGEKLDSWYLEAVARTICRMQSNSGIFVRDVIRNPLGLPRDGSGLLPRIFDIPLLAATLGFTLLSLPLMSFVMFLLPLVGGVELFFGAGMRAAFCAPAGSWWWPVLLQWSPIRPLVDEGSKGDTVRRSALND